MSPRKFVPFLAFGPITGPLLFGAVRAARAGRWWLAGVYLTGVGEAVAGLPAILLKLVAWEARRLGVVL